MSPAELPRYFLSEEFSGRLLRLRLEFGSRKGNIPSSVIAEALAIDERLVPVLFSWLGAWIATDETVENLTAIRNAEFNAGAIH